MNVPYKNGKNTGAIICFIVAGLVIIFGVMLASPLPFSWDHRKNLPDIFSIEWYATVVKYIIIALFLVCCGRIEGRTANTFIRWTYYIKNHGGKSVGRVVNVINDRYITLVNSDKTSYRFVIAYTSFVDGNEKTFTTPILNFVPKEGINYICDVYELYRNNHNFVSNSDENDGLIDVTGNRITFNFNPFELIKKIIYQDSHKEDYGNVYADNFRQAV